MISYMSLSGPEPVSSPLPSGSGPFYYDVNADGIVNVFDILGIISYMAAHPPGSGEGEGPLAPETVAEQTDLVSDLEELLDLVATDVASNRRRWLH